MKPFDWNEQKNSLLKETRGIGFEDVQAALQDQKLLDVIEHPDQKRYPGQAIYVIEINLYVFLVPCIEDDQKIFLKTIYPSRKFTKKYLKGV